MPLTRESVIDLVRDIPEETTREVHIVVTIDHEHDGLPIEVATIELRSELDGNWCLQYVSHPTQSCGLTASIAPRTDDLVAYARMHRLSRLPSTLSPLCAQDLEDEGVGPLAMLDLRCGNHAPVVPSKSDLGQLVALASLKPSL